MKICTKCRKIKSLEDFYIDSRAKSKLMSACKICTTNKDKEYNKNNKEKISAKNKSFREKNKDYYKKRCKVDIQFKLSVNLRSRLNKIIRGKIKSGSSIKDLGCSTPELRVHLENKFVEGMTWDNYGNKEGQWSIDHIKPLSKFDLTDREQLLEAVNYNNLQPMWHVDNIKKRNH